MVKAEMIQSNVGWPNTEVEIQVEASHRELQSLSHKCPESTIPSMPVNASF